MKRSFVAALSCLLNCTVCIYLCIYLSIYLCVVLFHCAVCSVAEILSLTCPVRPSSVLDLDFLDILHCKSFNEIHFQPTFRLYSIQGAPHCDTCRPEKEREIEMLIICLMLNTLLENRQRRSVSMEVRPKPLDDDCCCVLDTSSVTHSSDDRHRCVVSRTVQLKLPYSQHVRVRCLGESAEHAAAVAVTSC